MKKNISINLQGIIFHIEDDGYDVLSRYLQEVKAHFASYQGHEEIVADIEGRIAELFAARISPGKQVITLADVQSMTAKMGRVSDFNLAPDEDEDEPAASAYTSGAGQSAGFGRPGPPPPAGGPRAAAAAEGQPRRLYRDLAHRKIAGVCAGLAQYFMVSPVWIRLGFLVLLFFKLFINLFSWRHLYLGRNVELGGLALVTYVVLWIALPKRYDAPEPIDTLSDTGPLAGRKLYRDTNTGKVGGVSAGLAAYFNADVTLIRIIFLATTFVGGTGLIAYLILWAVVPEARTVSEKMQMRGDAVTLSGIDSNLRSAETDNPAGPNRPVGTFFENAAREARPAFGFVGRAVRVVVGAFLVFFAGTTLLSLAAVLGTVLSIFPPNAVQLGNEGTKYILIHELPGWSKIALFLVAALPMLALLLLGLRLLLRRSVLSLNGWLLLLGLWMLSIVGTAVAATQYAGEYRTRATYTTSRPLAAVPGNGLVLAVRDQDDDDDSNYLRHVRLRLAPADSNALGSVEQEFSARGRTQSAARLTAQSSIRYTFTQQDSTLTLDRGIELKEGTPFRNQQLTLTLHLPLGKTYTLTPAFLRLLQDDDFASRRRPATDEPYRARLTRQGRFACLGCADDDPSARANDNDNDNDDEVVKLDLGGNRMKMRVSTDGDEPRISLETSAASFSPDPAHYGPARKSLTDAGEFSELEARGPLRVVVRPGPAYKVEAAGRAADLRALRLSRAGDRVTLRLTGRTFNLFDLGGDDDDDSSDDDDDNSAHHAVLVTVTLPELHELSLNDACQANVSGFTQQHDLHVEARGASVVRLAAEVPTLSLDLHGASRADLSGRAQRLDLESHEASQVEALGLRADAVKATLHAASQASVRASQNLDVEASSASQVKYAGDPRVEQHLSSGSSLEQVRQP